ncbi:mechanosensitive ion channel domain-containing protein [Flavobacterium capsici]|uniref:Mechanosensitive ion channel n=1 Tax=Flavobacterium capsici TaxID=3075618 RepID=A0AA96F663_9FLAO|nr:MULTISPECIES: mechanosensitive ion channel domain-containing protein [unclassified Flavobacterium]WNM18229.1 mechanosensitive ion channel [Flavobacterium sp. PMR2A8]WNM22280.1 mechanosensitive ion channel [Flavobacterium sp. PMTSA4]
MKFLSNFTIEAIATIIVLIIVVVLRVLFTKLIRRYAKTHSNIEHRTNLVIKYIHLLLNIITVIILIIIWGVQKKDLLVTISSVATVIGVAMFAQWSILSNITSGIILFFFFPFKIGDTIKIFDKDFPIQAEIEDISAFHIDLITADGERITYPNNLLLQKGIAIVREKIEDKDFYD